LRGEFSDLVFRLLALLEERAVPKDNEDEGEEQMN